MDEMPPAEEHEADQGRTFVDVTDSIAEDMQQVVDETPQEEVEQEEPEVPFP